LQTIKRENDVLVISFWLVYLLIRKNISLLNVFESMLFQLHRLINRKILLMISLIIRCLIISLRSIFPIIMDQDFLE
jgi:hypothetical protein